MSSYKSRLNPPRRADEQPQHAHRVAGTRLPQRSVTPTAAIASQLPTPSHSKLQKKKPARDEEIHTGRGFTGQRVPVARSLGALKPRQGNNASTVPMPGSSLQSTTASKSVRQVSSSRLPKPEFVGSARTPSLISGSSTSTVDSPHSNTLRRKPSSIGVTSGRNNSRPRAGSMSSQEESQQPKALPGGFKDPFTETVLGISLPPSSAILVRSGSAVDGSDDGYYEYDAGSAGILSLPAPQYTSSTTPSTRYSESPGPFSVSSTPTSMSSYSPGIALSTKSTSRARQASPLQSRPPVTRHRTPDEPTTRQQHSLSSVRESSTSSSSASTVIADGGRLKDKQSSARLSAPPPSPPLPITLKPAASSRLGGIPKAQKSSVQAPPELAHLADHPSTSSPEPRRPTRPSREGTSDIVGLRGPSPVIQSNMMSFPTTHKRTSSTESRTGVFSSGRPRFGITPKPSSRNPSPNPSLASGFTQTSQVSVRGTTPEIPRVVEQRTRTLPTPAPAPAPAPASAPAPSPSKTSRFGFFRRTKTEPARTDLKSEKKLLRRGPTAGTGHEGYGRHAVRGRSGSSASGASIGRSASAATTTESLNRTPSSRKSSMTSTTSAEMDDFLLERLNPVVIRGTGSSTELSRSPEPMHTSASIDLARGTPAEAVEKTTSSARSALDENRPRLLPSAMPQSIRGPSPVKKMPLGFRRPSESDDDSKRSFLPSVTTKRTSRSSKFMDMAPLTKVGSSGSTGSKHKGAVIDNFAAENKEGRWLKARKDKQEPAATKAPRKWNFFQRAHATARVESPAVEVATAANKTPTSRSVAHYALMDSQTGIDLDDIEQLMQEAEDTPEDISPPADDEAGTDSQEALAKKERLQSILLPPMPVLPANLGQSTRSASPKVFLRPELQQNQTKLTIDTNVHAPEETPSQAELTPVTDLSPASSPTRSHSPIQIVDPVAPATVAPPIAQVESLPLPSGPPPSNPPPRPSRLPQVGRIPQVVSRRNQDRRAPSQSFSRPFVVDQTRPSPPRTSFDSMASIPVTAGPIEPYPILHGLDALSHGSAIATISPSAEESNRQSEFFKFPPRKDSEVSYSSSSGVWSFPFTAGTAIIPSPDAPQSEDEVWNEYNDLIDEVLSPMESNEIPFGPYKADKTPLKPNPSLEPLPLKTKSSHTSALSAGSISGLSNPSFHLRRSRLLAVLHSTQSPTSSVSFSEVFQDYGERQISVVDPITGRLSFPSTARLSTGSGPRNRPSSTRSSLPVSLSLSARQSRATLASGSDKDRDSATANRYRDTRLMEIAETQSDGLVSMANLRFGALMTSKWLSFGRVLFSPAHFELKDPNADRVLVIDGLGKDWSYYCALTYPEATVYNLGPGASSSSTTAGGSEPWSTLHNHRHIFHQSLASAFPFPRGFFACVVLRFPPALPSSVHRSIMSECKRVLRPGGHLELSVLDLDLVNMGNRARRAVRSLKVRMQDADEHISLRNISDEIMAGLGRKGFTECNRCFVGVPVAGKLPGPDDQDASDKKKRNGSVASSTGQATGSASKSAKQPKPEVSFSDILNTQTSSQSTDDSITDMVARVGRWWYSRCYESLVLPESGGSGGPATSSLLEKSIWRDESLINECEKRGTSFRLLIGYAQKPEVGVRRTVSV